MSMSSRWVKVLFQVGAVVIALLFTSLVLLSVNAQPLEAFQRIFLGAVGTPVKIADSLVAFVPLLLATAGLLITFTTGLWNIGIEGQVVLGAIFTTWALRGLQDSQLPAGLIIFLGFLAGMAGGALWAALVGMLKTFGGVNEIFGGLGLNFIATGLTNWLIFGPWKRPGIGSMSGTEPFPQEIWLPMLQGYRLSLWSLLIALVSIVIVYVIIQKTHFGLNLRAVGKGGKPAFMMGIPTRNFMMYSFIFCGIFAGLAGSVQVQGVYHRLIPSISSGYGFLGMLVAMLVNYAPLVVIPVALFYAALNIGGIQLPIVMKLDSTLSGVLQGALVLFVLIMDGVRRRITEKRA